MREREREREGERERILVPPKFEISEYYNITIRPRSYLRNGAAVKLIFPSLYFTERLVRLTNL